MHMSKWDTDFWAHDDELHHIRRPQSPGNGPQEKAWERNSEVLTKISC